MKKRTLGILIKALLVVGLFPVILLVVENGYVKWFIESKYSIENAHIEQVFQEDGSVLVHETIEYSMRKNFRGLWREIPQARYATMEDVKIWVDERPVEYLEYEWKRSNSFSVRIWMVPFQSSRELSPKQNPRLTLHIQYVANGIVESGSRVSQVLRQFWGSGWDAPAKSIEGVFRFEGGYFPDSYYTHPDMNVEQSGNAFTFSMKNVPPGAFGEVRFVFDQPLQLPSGVQNPSLTLAGIADEEEAYVNDRRSKITTSVLFFVMMVVLLLLVFFFFGREPHISYQGIYERELPTDDAPDVVNAVVANMAGGVDNNGIQAVMMELYRKDIITFEESKKLDPVIRFKQASPSIDLSGNKGLRPSEIEFFHFIHSYATPEGVFDFSELKKKLKKSESAARKFNRQFKQYTEIVRRTVRGRKYLRTFGYYLASFFGIVMMVMSVGLCNFMSGGATPDLLPLATFLSAIIWFSGSVAVILPKDVFGRWSVEGLTFYRKWSNFGQFLKEFSLLSQYPPESIVVWESYLVYATALGIADEVEKSLRKLVPREMWEQGSTHPYLYTPYTFAVGSAFNSLHTTAMSTVSSSSSGGGGFGGGAGGAGGGSGGGGGGAF